MTATRGAARRPRRSPHDGDRGGDGSGPPVGAAARRAGCPGHPHGRLLARGTGSAVRPGGRGAGQGREGAGHCGGVVAGAEDRPHAELAQPPLARRRRPSGDEAGDPHAVSGEVAQGVAVEAAQVGRDDGDPGDTGGSRRQQLGEVGAAAHEHERQRRVLEDPHELGLVAVR